MFNVYEEDCQAITANLMIKVYAISKQAKAYKNRDPFHPWTAGSTAQQGSRPENSIVPDITRCNIKCGGTGFGIRNRTQR